MAREQMLARVRAALADQPTPPAISRGYARASDPGTDLVGLFVQRARDYRATVDLAPADDIDEDIDLALSRHGIRTLVVPRGVSLLWLASTGARWLVDNPPLTVAELDSVDGVLTCAAVAIASTGTVVLDAGPGQGRRVLSLLPDYHLCVVRADQIVGTVSEAIARLDPTRPLTWISGPSATSDIELRRVEGVHGPRRLHLLVAV